VRPELVTRNLLRLAPRFALSIGLLVLLAFVVVDPRSLAADVVRMSPVAFVLAVGFTALDRVIMAFKWWLLLQSQRVGIDLWTTIRAYFATSFAGLFLPVTLGADAIRVLAVRRFGVHDITASIVVERTIGLIAMATVAIVSTLLLASALADVEVRSLAALVAGVLIFGAAGFVASIRVAGWWAARHEGGTSALVRIAQAYARYRASRGTLVVFYLLSIVECFVPVAINFVVARGLGYAIPLEVFVAGIPLALTIARLPISLGGFGVQEASFVYLAGLMGVPADEALSTMLVSDAVLLVTLMPSAFDVSMLNLRRQTV
jgi:uncharacterized membrane protein YbhN (UPF0104 family)